MRKKQKKEIASVIATLFRAHDEIIRLKNDGAETDSLGLLTQCQECAIEIGNTVEESDGKGTKAVSFLEEYCELLYQMSRSNERDKTAALKRQLTDVLIRFQQAVERELPDEPLKIVFMPYKASMWDCMESIWAAAVKDESCKVYVVPVPYLERKPDGQTEKECYEGELFPNYVDITAYKNFSLEEEQPDVIYIHNPYDGANYVTSVRQDYYSSNLKKYTDMLVYVPYFITCSGMPETHLMLPVYHYADKVIVENRQMKNDLLANVPEDKLLVAGSPKEDKMKWLEEHKKEINIPEEWREKINSRKVIFYNTSITSLLSYGMDELEKMQDVFACFQGRKDVVLLWRPHPLTAATLQSMRPELMEEYHRIEQTFLTEHTGILDKTPDVNASVAIADAYLGECTSSVVNLFKIVQKPVMYISQRRFRQFTKEEMQSVRTFDICRDGNVLWFVTLGKQLLCKLDLETGQLTAAAEIPEAPMSDEYQYVNIFKYNSKIVLIPYSAGAICEYDIQKQQFCKVYFKKELAENNFGRVFRYKNYLFLTPIDYPAIVRYDVENQVFTCYRKCIKEIAEKTGMKKGSRFMWGASAAGTELILGSMQSNHILAFNMETESYKIFQCGTETDAFRGMVSCEEYSFMILTDSPDVIRLNRMTGETVRFTEFPEGFLPGRIPFKSILLFDNKLILVPYHASHICIMDKDTGEVAFGWNKLPYKEKEFKSCYYEKSGGAYDFAKKISEQEFAALSLYDDSMMILNVKEESYKKYPLRIPDLIRRELGGKEHFPLEIVESAQFPVSKYIEYVIQAADDAADNYRSTMTDDKGSIGQFIHTRIKEAVN